MYRSSMFLLFLLFLSMMTFSTAGTAACERTDVQNMTQDKYHFDLSMYSRIVSSEGGNVCFSPLSINTALSMVYEGAEAYTSEQMGKVLGINAEDRQRHKDIKELLNQLESEKEGLKVHIANSLWTLPGYGVKDDYLLDLQYWYGSELREADLVSDPAQAAAAINSWVEGKTSGRIKDLFQESSFNRMTRLVLVNTVYFLGDWEKPFSPSSTEKGIFIGNEGEIADVSFMNGTERWSYYEDELVQVVDLPYRGGEYTLMILLPKETKGLEKLEGDLTGSYLDRIRDSLSSERIDLSLPKFEIRQRIKATSILQEMGMTNVFDPSEADLSGISSEERLYLSEVVHAAFLRIDEKGTEAAAATGISIKATSIPAEPISMTADHPFLYILYHEKTESLLFLGRITDPSGR